MGDANLSDKLNRTLPAPTRVALAALVGHAERERLTLYLVGGSVRDLLLGRPTLDIDLAVEGDATTVAGGFATDIQDVRCILHPAFRTATLKGADFRLDIATARSETYERPGALPVVHLGSLPDDLRRRDFTVNAIALVLTGDQRGAIIDPSGGKADLEDGLIRVLHRDSFRDDATRILRAARYESRLDFRLERETLRWLRRDVAYLDTISGPRIRDELLRTLREPKPESVLLRLQELGALPAIHPALSFDARRSRSFVALRRMRADPSPTAYLTLLAWDLSPEEASSFAARLALNRRETEAVQAVAAVHAVQAELSTEVKPSRTVELLSPFPSVAVWALAAVGGEATRQQALRYLRRLRYVKPLLDGHALLAMGVPRGPQLGEVLSRLKAAKLDGEARSRRDEERMARDMLGLGAGARK
jgi:tRNA nucleotidyltransferase (CCA-adding enzyme)